uniref:Uncharacterized protein n=1 Tax=Parasteatoda tepidariorum TaxID=114398 RepID=A0A2L2YS52_PARTP
MVLSLLIFTSNFISSPSWGLMTPRELETFRPPKSFRLNEKNLPKINDQESTLASTLENFIVLAEKFEAAFPT